MTLVKCSECGAEISDAAAACPQCGAPRKAAKAGQPASVGTGVGCLAVLVAVLVIGSVSKSCGDASDRRAAVRKADERADAAKQQRQTDSVRVWALADSAERAPAALELDDLVHRYAFTLDHEAAHRRTLTIRLDSARLLLRSSRPTGPQLGAAAALLQGVRPPLTDQQRRDSATIGAALEREQKKAALATALRGREQYAIEYEKRLLDQGMNVTVSTRGRDATTLRLRWILVSKVLAHKMSQDPDFFARLRELGFKRFEITDGYDETWYWTL